MTNSFANCEHNHPSSGITKHRLKKCFKYDFLDAPKLFKLDSS